MADGVERLRPHRNVPARRRAPRLRGMSPAVAAKRLQTAGWNDAKCRIRAESLWEESWIMAAQKNYLPRVADLMVEEAFSPTWIQNGGTVALAA